MTENSVNSDLLNQPNRLVNKYLKDQNRYILLTIFISVLGLILFLIFSSTFPFKNKLLNFLYPKSASLAAEITGDLKWDTFPVRYYISTQNLPYGITRDDLKNAVERAFGNWLKYPGHGASAEFLQFIDSVPDVTKDDRKNIIGFKALSNSKSIAITAPWTDSTTGMLADVDVAL